MSWCGLRIRIKTKFIAALCFVCTINAYGDEVSRAGKRLDKDSEC